MSQGRHGLGEWLRNGGRLYIDSGSHPEYATPETSDSADTVACEDAGDMVAYEILSDYARQLGYKDMWLGRMVADTSGNTWGYHENYSVPEENYEDEFLAAMLPFLATRNIIFGAGMLDYSLARTNDLQAVFRIAQKSQSLRSDINASTTSNKPMICTRPEPHAAPDEWVRFMVVCGDPNMSPWASRVKLGVTRLAIAACMYGYVPEQLRVRRDRGYLIAQQVASDLTLRQTVELQEGYSIRPIDVQRSYLAAMQKMATDYDIGDRGRWVMAEYERGLDDLGRDPMLLIDRADWPLRMHMLQRHMDQNGVGPADPSTVARDFAWPSVRPDSMAAKLRKTVWRQWSNEAAADRVRRAPPQDTRAAVRGRFVTAVLTHRSLGLFDGGWAEVTIPDSNDMTILPMMDPFSPTNEAIDSHVTALMQ
jgi:proteasome accessory factor A